MRHTKTHGKTKELNSKKNIDDLAAQWFFDIQSHFANYTLDFYNVS